MRFLKTLQIHAHEKLLQGLALYKNSCWVEVERSEKRVRKGFRNMDKEYEH